MEMPELTIDELDQVVGGLTAHQGPFKGPLIPISIGPAIPVEPTPVIVYV
jgi:bacteriocin-like protein